MVKRGIGMTAVISFSFFPLMCGARWEVGLMGWRRERRGMAKMVWVLSRVRLLRAGVFVQWVRCYAPPCCAIVACGLSAPRCDNTRARDVATTTACGGP